jgi:transposase
MLHVWPGDGSEIRGTKHSATESKDRQAQSISARLLRRLHHASRGKGLEKSISRGLLEASTLADIEQAERFLIVSQAKQDV